MMSTPSGTGGLSGNLAGTKLKGCSCTAVPAVCRASMPSPSIQMRNYILEHASGYLTSTAANLQAPTKLAQTPNHNYSS